MKAISPFGYLLALFLLVSFGPLHAQDPKPGPDREKAAQEEEMKARKEMLDAQHKEMKEMERQFEEQSRINEARVRDMERSREMYRSSGIPIVEPVVAPIFTQGNQAQLTLRNSFSGGSDATKGDFQVEQGTRQFRCMISGRVRLGEITIRVMYPGGKVFKELTINSSAEINFSQLMTIKEGEEEKYIGTWKYEVKADKAEGNYMLQISTN
jgi:hypothetical protein